MNTNNIWDSTLKVGNDIIDNQHNILFDLIKDLKHAIGVGANIKNLDALLSVLLNYAFNHFQTEEEYFRKHNDYKEHCLEHYTLIKRLFAFIADIRNSRIKNDRTVSDFLEEWLLDHIKRFDKPFFIHETEDQFSISESLPVDDYDLTFEERRYCQRISYNEVVDGNIVTHYYNATQLSSGKAKIVDMSPGGLKLRSNSDHSIDDLLIVSCSIGSTFKMKEKVKVISANGHFYGVKFISPARETIAFFEELYGSVYLNRAKLTQHIS